ncbi:hypothetical protein BX600DRAFT_514569 [Xylariales sp. PMI_506]|nr:hypothetical protein BX600DRAFT_514569 [Xylariales sp. PMI_506]
MERDVDDEETAPDVQGPRSATILEEDSKSAEQGERLARIVKDLYASGAKMWTKEMFSDIEQELSKKPMPDFVRIRTMSGELVRSKIPDWHRHLHAIDTENWSIGISFTIYQRLVKDARDGIFRFEFNEDRESCLHDLYTCKTDDKPEIDNCARLLLAPSAICFSVQEIKPPPPIDASQLRSAWNEARQNWLQSTVCAKLAAILTTAPHFSATTNKVVGFGLGSLEVSIHGGSFGKESSEDGLPLCRAMTQHAAALTVAHILGSRLGDVDNAGPRALPVLVQDPVYSPVAQQLLKEEGIQVVSGYGSLAFTHVDDDSVVISCHPNIPVKQIIADIARPSAMIWNEVCKEEVNPELRLGIIDGEETWISPWTTDEDSPRTRQLIEGYDTYEFPASERFGKLAIYIRRD